MAEAGHCQGTVETRYGFNLNVIVKNSFTALVTSSCAFALYATVGPRSMHGSSKLNGRPA
jgi:hypothetical protein